MNSWKRACLVSVWSTNVRQSQTHARHVEMETCNDQTTLRKTHHCIAEPCLSTKTPASQHHNQNRACADESVLAQKKHQQRQHYEDWICLAFIHQVKRCPLHLDVPEEGTCQHHHQPNTTCVVSPSKHSQEKYQRHDKSPSSGRTHCQQHPNQQQTFALPADRTWGHSGESLHCSCC